MESIIRSCIRLSRKKRRRLRSELGTIVQKLMKHRLRRKIADAELRRMHSKNPEFYDSIFTQLRDQQGTTWHCNSPGSPRERFRNRVVCVTVESEENVQSDAVSKPASSVSAEVKTAVAISTPQLHTSEQAVMSSAGPSTTSTSDELEVTASTSSSAAVGSLETDVASSSPIDTDELKKPELDQGETLMPWRLRPINHYMTYIPTPKAKLKEWRDNLRKRDALIRHKRCSDTTVIDIFEDGFQISDEEYAKWLGQ
ncbi:unnamed protein product [Trichogramma brassicae]|uniref:Uncharacterized protein n=1 Tax=Trichogramma brassicae TaxID=86971 RepID=A0A6H5I5I6_9HYME|nr:unnamed protein product [Trichogramma brassicae]